MANTTCDCGDLDIISQAANLYLYRTIITDLFSLITQAIELYANYRYGNY